MSAANRTPFTPEAIAAFAELVARHDRGETVDFEREFVAHEAIAGELRALHANWKALDSLLGGLQVSESAIDELERELGAVQAPVDGETREELERLSSPERMQRRYAVRERLARGGMGEVWRVYDADLRRDLAMKLIRARSGEDPRTPDGRLLRQFLFEARLTGRLDHPGIVPVHDIGVDPDGRVYFTMPLVRGRSLSEILELERDGREGWTRSRVLEVVLKVCDTLAFAHAQGVVHRDLKPGNVMVGRFGETYVMDWGLARVLSEIEDSERTEIVGTAAYMSPEQAKGQANEVGPRSDIYSLGAILYELLAGRRPYALHDEGSGRAVIDAVRAGPPPKLEDLALTTPELVAIAKKAMVRSPDGRYADMEAMAADLRAYMEGRVVRAHEAGRWPELRKWIARNRLSTVTFAAALIALIGVLAWFSYSQGKSAVEIQRLGDLRRVEELEQRAEELWPAVPALEPALKAWLVEAEELAARAPEHERELARMRAAGPVTMDKDAAWRIDALATLVDRLGRFRDPYAGLGAVASVRARLLEAQRIGHESLDVAAQAWSDASAAIADIARSPAYRGLVLAPQVGLVPLGPDPETGLHEFAHVGSGRAPTRDSSGKLVLGDDAAIVLVLVPGGSFQMGSVAPEPGRPSGALADPAADASEMPLEKATLAPFFVAKFELTVAQWAALSARTLPAGASALEPAHSIAWTAAERALRHAGLALPTEAQWEYAARARTTTRWWCGQEPGSLSGRANGAPARLDRGPAQLMRVDALEQNPFGLVHVHGNVAEWTRDVFASYSTPMLPGDGLRVTPENGMRSVRGGSYDSPPNRLRSAAREPVAHDNIDARIGVRPARAIERAVR
jgi:serine/threonine-protein kinase